MRRGLLSAAAMAAAVLGSVAVPAAANAAGPVSSASSDGDVTAMSCAPGGTCAAGGDYFDASSKEQQAFVVTELGGNWGAAVEVPGLAADGSKESAITAISCATGGCTAGGWWRGRGAKSRFHAFVTTEQNGNWSRLTSVLSQKVAFPDFSHVLEVSSVSCTGPRNCTVSGGAAGVRGERGQRQMAQGSGVPPA